MESPPPDLHPSPPRPCVLLGASTGLRLQRYAADLAAGAVPGARLQAVLDALPARPRTVEAMLDALFRTRLPMIFAESAVRGDGSDWTADFAIKVGIPMTTAGMPPRASMPGRSMPPCCSRLAHCSSTATAARRPTGMRSCATASCIRPVSRRSTSVG